MYRPQYRASSGAQSDARSVRSVGGRTSCLLFTLLDPAGWLGHSSHLHRRFWGAEKLRLIAICERTPAVTSLDNNLSREEGFSIQATAFDPAKAKHGTECFIREPVFASLRGKRRHGHDCADDSIRQTSGLTRKRRFDQWRRHRNGIPRIAGRRFYRAAIHEIGQVLEKLPGPSRRSADTAEPGQNRTGTRCGLPGGSMRPGGRPILGGSAARRVAICRNTFQQPHVTAPNAVPD